jgi:hypothetical protein
MASIFARFFGRTVSEAAGVAAGIAVASPLRPVVQLVENETWALHPDKPVPVEVAAAIVAEDVEALDWGREQASFTGFPQDSFDAILGEQLNAPGIPQLFEAWRRDLIDDATFTHGLRKAKLETRWDAPLKALKQRLLSLDQLANARQQGFIDTARQHSEAALQGQDADRADIAFELSGLPLGVETMQFAANRGLVDRATFDQAIREGHTKTKYTELAWALRQPVLSASEYARLHLKGWIDVAAMNAGGALHGYTPEQMNLLYLGQGRPAAPGQMATAAARGIDGPAGRPVDRAQFLTAIQQSDIRPEYGPMLWETRFLYPPLFQLSRLVTAGAISADTAADWARKDRYPPEVVTALHDFWSRGSTATADPHVGRAQTHLWNTTHNSYRDDEIDAAQARGALTTLGLDTAAQTQVLALWDAEKALIRRQLSPADIRKAYRKQDLNVATGLAWTRDDAKARLVELGYDSEDAENYLNIG